ncbi:dolichyl-phosphate-mannose-protein mannosyltransferase [Motilibacter rhizosphaerae]|uniref:Dolichyl-phosphate-mannose-protein mannosyltransferase n=1 Tax=Motilibacter rhizosphaerae TaxID=598652 RepID=A0A4V2F2Q8_9ACTN|nr:glycosyltransferase family 39 protein [Motilibacter rhizosphaerae]RZS78998.1 dolichyl-phosphate-mannose-protein mannosyltransferase [Motilibacter rhizosphaerae]
MVAPRTPLAVRPLALGAGALVVVLLLLAGRYGYHRDELYFRVLGQHPDWGAVDQPPLTPLVARAETALLGDTVTALRVVPAVCASAYVLLLALLARELGGGRGAQLLAATGALGSFPLIAGHTLSTATLDLVTWLGALLLVTRALLRGERRCWLWAGVVVGLGLYAKLLVALLLLGLLAGLLLVGPRRPLRDPLLWAGALLVLAVGAPNIVYQIVHGFPERDMAASLAAHKGSTARATFVPLQLVMLGPLLVPVWVAGLLALLRRPEWRPVRAVAVAYLLVCAFLLLSGGQPYYTLGLVAYLWAAGCVVAARWRRGLVLAAVVVDAAVSAVIALPLVPLASLGSTPVPVANQVVRDSVGWPAYAQEVAAVWTSLPQAERAHAVVVTANYGEQGALARYGPELGLPRAYSGQNQLWHVARPPDSATTTVLVGFGDAGEDWLHERFGSCTVRGRLDDRVGVDSEEQDEPVRVCTGVREPWSRLWPRFAHLD